MNSLHERLRALGVKVGAESLPPSSPHSIPSPPIAGGVPHPTPFGETFVIEKRLPVAHLNAAGLSAPQPQRRTLARWAGWPSLNDLPWSSFAFLDTETSGLSLGAGTYPFLVSVGRFEDQEFHLAQFLLRQPGEEAALLAAVESFLSPCEVIVTYNGKTFDLPLLRTRYLLHGLRFPLQDHFHLDLLPLARRLWRNRLPQRSLIYLEAHILGVPRPADDTPGWLAPARYFEYLHSGDPQPLQGVIDHNARDVLSLVTLLHYLNDLLENPVERGRQYSVDLIALGRLFEDLNDPEMATRLYLHGLEHDDARYARLPRRVLLHALERLALIYKRQDNWASALYLWEEAARHGHIKAFVELAKYYEHLQGDAATALRWTEAALHALAGQQGQDCRPSERRRWRRELEHRRQRLERKRSGYPSP